MPKQKRSDPQVGSVQLPVPKTETAHTEVLLEILIDVVKTPGVLEKLPVPLYLQALYIGYLSMAVTRGVSYELAEEIADAQLEEATELMKNNKAPT